MKTEQEVADSIIAEMMEAGLSYEEMIRVIRLAREKFRYMKELELDSAFKKQQ